MRVPVVLSVLAFLVVLGGSRAEARQASDRFCNPNGGAYNDNLARNMTLSRSGNKFTVGGQPTFLTSFSYFGANHVTPEAAYVTFKQACDAGFNAVRIFADYWDNVGSCAAGNFPYATSAPVDYRAILPGGGLGTATNNLAAIILKARQAGLVVDLSFGVEVVAGRTIANMVTGLTTVGQILNANPAVYDHVMIDVQNEFDNFRANHPCYTPIQVGALTPTQQQQLINAAKGGNANRIVFMSGGASPNSYGSLLENLNAGGNAIAVHESRAIVPYRNWYTPSLVSFLAPAAHNAGARYPIYMQEPDRWMSPGYGTCSLSNNGVVDNECELTAGILLNNAKDAMRYGAAGWTFHTEALFFPHRPGLRTLSGEENAVIQGLRGTLTGVVWGDLGPVGWMR